MLNRLLSTSVRTARRIAIGVIGATVCLIGVIMLVTPGPAFVVIPAGLAILSIEFAFARRWLTLLRRRISDTMQNQRIKSR
ncbi:MAG: PGPGW domain-containing protein [Pseudomonadota bacterium]